METTSKALATAQQHHQADRLQEAAQIYREILATEPNNAQVWHLLGAVAWRRGLRDVAIQCSSRAIELNADYAEPHNDLAIALQSQGKDDDAIACFRRVLERRPNYAEGYYNTAFSLKRQGKLNEAVNCYRRAIGLKPDFAEAHNNLGDALQCQGRPDDAIASYRRTLELQPSFAQTHYNLANIFKEQSRFDEAAVSYLCALELKPNFAEAANNLGAVYSDQGKWDQAILLFRQALDWKPDYAEAHNNLGNALKDEGQIEAAAACYNRATMLLPNYAEPQWNQSLLKLLQGNFADGWPGYEWRWKTGKLTPPHFHQPSWDGQPLSGRTILLHAEQGFGDTIQFIRYAPQLKRLGATVLVVCQKPLVKLLGNCPGIDRLIADGDDLPQFDCHAALLSLPGIFKTTLENIPAIVPYLSADQELVSHWRAKLESIHGFRIGINWHGREGNVDSERRDIPLDFFASLAQLPDVRLISLQKGGRRELASATSCTTIVDLGDNVDTEHGAFMDTAAIMKNLDLVITSDTSVPHLAGALGVPVWVALPFVPDWRWLLDRSDSPWYPTMRLFRQKRTGDWATVFEEILTALRDQLRAKREIA